MVSTSSLTQHAGPRSLRDLSDLASDSGAHSGQHRQWICGAEAAAPAPAPVAGITVKTPGDQNHWATRRINLAVDDITIEPAVLGGRW
jgi:hypothetical protein